ncbi:hypothetical protein EJ02DRAFT_57555 [Clathrospora elynae]|uniref:Uncharacterized protein n=1 Tax=Clathrospora elynae TaxID=706981 RepID=A0A6A5SJ02_9PLEO|nr:hypothetical protein EJ02DRAFT_57555 [Clathrospora elynae]
MRSRLGKKGRSSKSAGADLSIYMVSGQEGWCKRECACCCCCCCCCCLLMDVCSIQLPPPCDSAIAPGTGKGDEKRAGGMLRECSGCKYDAQTPLPSMVGIRLTWFALAWQAQLCRLRSSSMPLRKGMETSVVDFQQHRPRPLPFLACP